MKRILALAAHPDDVEIGCGGTLASYVDRGAEVHLFVATDGGRGGDMAVRRAEQEEAARILGIKQVHWGDFDDTHLPSVADKLIQSIDGFVEMLQPLIVLVNHHEDTHQDHRALARAAHSATRYVPSVLAYETPTSTNFDPKVFMDISDMMERKTEALKAHASQVERTNIQGLDILEIAMATAHFRGIQGRLNSAEAFMPVRVQL
ncbi:MAG TPA: PIG-L deacetylase family protein [Mariprofundaceae bacterium]|nr:PIG-L deacetylase family protein [Mariprofundaceae bacterium]